MLLPHQIMLAPAFFQGFETGIEYSPNKKSLNNECNIVERCVFTNLKTAFAGNQAQEKGNVIQNCKMWGNIGTCFQWRGQPGHYMIKDINIAMVDRILDRYSGGFFPLYMENIFAEGVGTFGNWMGGAGDYATGMIINFRYPTETGSFPDYHFKGDNILFNACNFRYYGYKKYPMMLNGNNTHVKSLTGYVNPVIGRYAGAHDPDWQKGYKITQLIRTTVEPSEDRKAVVLNNLPSTGDIVVFSNMGNGSFAGMAEVESNSGKAITLKYISPGIKAGVTYNIGLYGNNSI